MNRIYKVIWSHVRNGYVVVSELAKGRGKVAAQKSARVLTAAVLGMVLGGAAVPAYAETPTLPVTSDLTHTIAGSSFLVDKNGQPIQITGSGDATIAPTVVIMGSLNGVKLGDKPYDGVASSIIGQANYTENANAAVIYGAANRVINSYREVKDGLTLLDKADPLARAGKWDELSQLLQEAVPESGGQVMVMGGANTVDKGYLSQVMGVGNILTGNTNELSDSATQLNFVDGFYNNVSNGQHIYVLGSKNTVKNAVEKDNTKENHHNTAIGDENSITGSINTKIVGDNNEVLNGWYENNGKTFRKVVTGVNKDVKIYGSGNKAYGSHRQLVLGDNNEIIARDSGTVSDYKDPDGRELYTMDLTIGRNNTIHNNYTYRNQWESVKVIGNNNNGGGGYGSLYAGGPNNVILIGDNQNFTNSGEMITIGSISPEEQKEMKNGELRYQSGGLSIMAGFHSYVRGGSVLIGTRSYSENMLQTIVGHGSSIDNLHDGSNWLFGNGMYGTINGSFNWIRNDGVYSRDESEEKQLNRKISGFATSIQGTYNEAKDAMGAHIIGAGNEVQHSYLGNLIDDKSAIGGLVFTNYAGSSYFMEGRTDVTVEDAQKAMQDLAAYGGGGVSVLGNANKTDYAIRSQILGTANEVTGTEEAFSVNNTVSGFMNKGTNLKQTTLVGTGNILETSEDNVVVGDYHELKNGKHNVILGSRESEEATITKTATGMMGEVQYEVKVQKAKKAHKDDLENAVFLGYNTDVTENDGVALGSFSVADRSADEDYGFGYEAPDASAPVLRAANTDYVWKPTLAAVSVGGPDSDGNINTRRITYVAAGLADTDAVNVAQLRAATVNPGSSISLVAGDGIKLEKDSSGNWTISTNFKDSGSDKVTYEEKNDSTAATEAGRLAVIETKLTADDKGETKLAKDGKLGIMGSENIATTISGSNVNVALKDSISVNKISIKNGGPTISSTGIDMNNKKITNVADGEVSPTSKDAINGSQLYEATKDVRDVSSRIERLGDRVDKVGAHAAALAALHPLDFDRDNKLDFAAGTGSYRGSTALAIGAFYRPDNRTMLSLGGSTGGGENMWNFGVSVKLGRVSEYEGVSKAQLIAENEELKRSDAIQDQKIQELMKIVAELQQKVK
ncbi:ESPR-type extended signal peptide-containing protein [Acidaminococcus sp.]|uniref:ESPR-type extended signal peptide-containing protein n=1 Tax=Acidaminococcus sp. TaxID=1872103 RepID=UPI003AB45C09